MNIGIHLSFFSAVELGHVCNVNDFDNLSKFHSEANATYLILHHANCLTIRQPSGRQTRPQQPNLRRKESVYEI